MILKNHSCICKIRKCKFREPLKIKDIINKNLDISKKHRTCIYYNSSICLANKLYLE